MCAVFRLRRGTSPSLIVKNEKIMSLSFYSPHSVIPAPKHFSFAPIAVAVAAVLTAAASPAAYAATHDPFKLPDQETLREATITLKLDQISNDDSYDWISDPGPLFSLDGCNDSQAKTAVQWWVSDPADGLYSTSGNPQDFDGAEHVKFTVTNDTGHFNLGWDFSLDTSNASYSPAISNFRFGAIDNDKNVADQFLKHFTFRSAEEGGQIAIVTRNSKVQSTNSGTGEAMLGLSVLNKRGWMTFENKTYLVSDFQFQYDDVNGNDTSGTAGEYIAAGVVAGFGASSNSDTDGLFDLIFEPNSAKPKADLDLDKYGLIEFNKRSIVSVTSVGTQNEDKYGRLHEVFGVFVNEGGAVKFNEGGDVLVKGRDKHHLVSALTSASTLGILDPLKSGEITFIAGSDVNRIWGWSDSYEGDAPVTVGSGHSLDNPDAEPQETSLFGTDGKLTDEAFKDMREQIEGYLEIATGGNDIVDTDQHLRGSILAANGAVITVTDEGVSDGWLDIRGDVVAAVKNGEDAGSNTFVSAEGPLGTATHANFMDKTVTRAEVKLHLTQEKSTLVGNVYERHRVGSEEAVQKTFDGTSAIQVDQSFDAWQKYQYEEERKTLGGTVDLSISNGAVWYPTKDWKGWNYDFLYEDFFDETDGNAYGTVYTDYEYYDVSDQYNLHVDKDKDGVYELANAKGDSTEDTWKINDLDLKSVDDKIATSGQKENITETVQNGVYHLTLNGGTVDLSYLRRDFKMSTAQDNLGVIDPNEKIEVKDVNGNGVKKFRVQALNGSSGNFRIYAKDATHHDLVIVDEMRNAANEKVEDASFNLNLVLWNDGIGDEHKLTVTPGDKSTYIQVARVPDSVNVTAESYGEGRTTYTAYRVVKDEKTKDPVTGNMVYGEGSYTYEQGLEWHDQNVNWFIKGEAENRKDMAVIGTTELAANLGYLMATTMETLRDRRGEMAFNGTKEDGWWVRYTHDRFGLDGFTAETDGFQFGYEWMKPEEGGRLFRGAALDVAQGDVEYDSLSGDSEADRYRLSAYQTYMGDNGVYYDAVLRAGWYDAETNVAYTRHNGTVYDMKGNFDYWAAAASFEAGHRFESSSAWWIEPEVQLQYTYITDYDYKTNHGIRVDTDDTQSLIGRFGVRMGKVLTSDAGRHMSVWAGADVFHEWLGDRDGTMTGIDETVRYDISGDDTWWDTVFGMTWETGPDSRLWAAAKHDFGGDKENTWTVNVGATWNF